MNILGIDPGLNNIGIGIISSNKNKYRFVYGETFHLKKLETFNQKNAIHDNVFTLYK